MKPTLIVLLVEVVGSLWSKIIWRSIHFTTLTALGPNFEQIVPFLSRYQTNNASAVLTTIANIQPKDSSGGGGETREAFVNKMAEEMLSKLPPDYNPFEVIRYLFVPLLKKPLAASVTFTQSFLP